MSDVITRGWLRSRKKYSSYMKSGSLGYSTPVHQRLRYEGLLRHVDPVGMSILDFGCGHGRLYEELVLRGRMPSRYHGVDLIKDNLQEAERRTAALVGSNAARITAAFGGPMKKSYDITCALAVFSVDEGDHTEDLWSATIDDLWSRTERTLVFDLLRAEPGRDHPDHHRLSMPAITQIASELSPNHLIDASLADHFALVVVNREPTRSRSYWDLRGVQP